MTGMKMPLEIYPLVGMMGVALGLGGYTSYKHLSTNPDMRLTPAQGSSDVENWQSRIEKVSEKKRFTNFFYNFDKI
ncbi:hypothetical protein HDU79_004319 [Rhizoclosmatium sp. JEL0117]|nr:hypothetical protein HDU99_006957 [Rhizoclosmatium hyalinum]KAJ3289080.1 hypothetical protein HDU79_004319 [Rhizoclosmatium sp. JEL0117]